MNRRQGFVCFALSLCWAQFELCDSRGGGILLLECPCAPHNLSRWNVKNPLNSIEFKGFLCIMGVEGFGVLSLCMEQFTALNPQRVGILIIGCPCASHN